MLIATTQHTVSVNYSTKQGYYSRDNTHYTKEEATWISPGRLKNASS